MVERAGARAGEERLRRVATAVKRTQLRAVVVRAQAAVVRVQGDTRAYAAMSRVKKVQAAKASVAEVQAQMMMAMV